jgi:broad specificity phosphatase PhoE
MRHAEKKMDVSDAALNDLGKRRAELLVEQLSLVRIDGFFSTPYIRTRTTLAPLATKRGQAIREYLPKNGTALLDSLKSQPGKTYLISGHSNTIPDLVNHLMNDPNKYSALQDDEYDRLFMVMVWPDGRSKDVVLRLVVGNGDR